MENLENIIVALLVQLEEITRRIFAGNNLLKQEEDLLRLRCKEIAALIEQERQSFGFESAYQNFTSSNGIKMFAYIAPDDIEIHEGDLSSLDSSPEIDSKI